MTNESPSSESPVEAHIIERQHSLKEDWDKNYNESFDNIDALMADFGTFALKSSMLINGGALASIFAFFSQILTSENIDKSIAMSVFSAFKNSVIFWIIGLCLCLFSIGLTYAHYYLQAHNINLEFKERWKETYQRFPKEFSHLRPSWLDAGVKFAPVIFSLSIITAYMSVLALFAGFWFCIEFVYGFSNFFVTHE